MYIHIEEARVCKRPEYGGSWSTEPARDQNMEAAGAKNGLGDGWLTGVAGEFRWLEYGGNQGMEGSRIGAGAWRGLEHGGG